MSWVWVRLQGFYLGDPVEIVGASPDGWVMVRAEKDKLWRMWGAQIKTEPWGEEFVL